MKKFIGFLEENCAWENFEKEFRKHGRDLKTYKKRCKEGENLELKAAFPWSYTAQGSTYWERLDAKWRQINNAFREQLLSDD